MKWKTIISYVTEDGEFLDIPKSDKHNYTIINTLTTIKKTQHENRRNITRIVRRNKYQQRRIEFTNN